LLLEHVRDARSERLPSTPMLRQALLLVRDVPASVLFYGPEGVGMPILHYSETWAELGHADTGSLALKHTSKEAELSRGFTPMLCIDVADVDAIIPTLIMKGAVMDGGIRREIYGTFCAVKTPDGCMLGLRQPAPQVNMAHKPH